MKSRLDKESCPQYGGATAYNQKPPATIVEQIGAGAHLATHRPYADIYQIFERFTEDMHQLNLDSFSTPAVGVVALEVAGAVPAGDATS